MNESMKESNIEWHRLFGLTLIDFFTDSPYEVELEKELSLQKQFIDAIIIRKYKDQIINNLPDGLNNLNEHNLLSYKSHQESLNEWAIEELIEYYVLYRKLISPASNRLTDSNKFSLYAVSARYPNKLLSQVHFEKVQDGVYEIKPVSKTIRIIVLKEIQDKPENAIWDLFSAISDKVAYGKNHYHWKRTDLNPVINKLFNKYNLEGLNMPYTVDDFKRELKEEVRQEVKKEEKVEIAKKLLQEGIDIKTIKKVTDLSDEEIEKLN